jgi:hypothetical protein
VVRSRHGNATDTPDNVGQLGRLRSKEACREGVADHRPNSDAKPEKTEGLVPAWGVAVQVILRTRCLRNGEAL